MKLRLLWLACALSVLMTVPAVAQSTVTPVPSETPRGSYVIGTDIYVRGGPGETYLPVGRLVAGDVITPVNRSSDGDWLMIRYSFGFGWIRRDLANWAVDVESLPLLDESQLTPTSLFTPTATDRYTATPTGVFIRAGSVGARIRSGPAVRYFPLGAIVSGEQVEPVGRSENNLWVLIRYRDGFGWIALDLLSGVNNIESLPVLLPGALTPSATFTATATPSITPTPTASATPSATPTASPTITPSITPTLTATFTATPTDTLTATDTATFTPTPTDTPLPTSTPTATSSPTPVPTDTATPTATPTATATFTATATSTSTPSATNTSTTTPSDTPLPSSTPSATASPTASPVPSDTATLSDAPTRAAAALVVTATPSATPTNTPSASPTDTPSPTPTPTDTATVAPTDTVTPSATAIPPSSTPTATSLPPSLTPTATSQPPSLTPTRRATIAQGSVSTATETAIAVPLPSDTSPPPTRTNTPSPTDTAEATASAAPTATPSSTATSSATPTENAAVILPGALPTPVSTLPTEPQPAPIPPEAIVGGAALILLLIYVGLYWRGLAAADRYADGFVIERCPICGEGHLLVEVKQTRLLGIPRSRSLVRCDFCRSMLREVGNRRWRYAVDRSTNPALYRQLNGKIVDVATLKRLESEMLAQAPYAPPPVHPPTTPPTFIDED